MTERVRIQKALSNSGIMSRRDAEAAIAAGRIAVDGITAVLGDRIDVSSQTLTIDGVPMTVDPDVETHLLYKPIGVVSTARDPQGRPTVVDLVDSGKTLYPVGRLDMDSEGLILVSNDGELANRVTHPRYGVTKTYLVVVEGKVAAGEARHLVSGIQLDDGLARAISARVVDAKPGKTMIRMVMGEGRNRELRRMMEAMGHSVERLVRTAIGPITDPTLQPGQSRRLTPSEIRTLFQASQRG